MKLQIRELETILGAFRLTADLDLPSGQLISLLGPSGCGKTTLLKSVAGLYIPDRGRIVLGDRDITGLDPRYRKIGMVFQDYALFPHMSVEQNICYGMKEKGKDARRRAAGLLEMVRLSGYEKRKPDELSGGEKQRIALARAMATDPDLLLLDEPLSALDAQLRRSLRRQIREIQQETGITALYVTHDQEEAMAISDLIVLMEEGHIRQWGAPEELYSSPANAFAGKFIGTANMIPVSALRTGEEGTVCTTAIDEVVLPVSGVADTACYLHFRPEECRLEETAGAAGTDRIVRTGKLLYREFGGDFQYLEVQTADAVIRLKSGADQPFRQGDELTWSVPAAACRLLS